MSRWAINIFEMLDAVRNLPAGEYAECGVWKGYMAAKIYAGMSKEATLFLFDTFTGHGEPGEHDAAAHHPKGRYADTSYEEIRKLCPDASINRGPVQEILPAWGKVKSSGLLAPPPFRFVHIDMDHYEPTRSACEFFKPRMVKGGIIRFDDYRHPECPGATLAINEVFGSENILSNDYRWVA